MLSEVQTKSANYLRIIAVLKALRERGYINDKEYARALFCLERFSAVCLAVLFCGVFFVCLAIEKLLR